MNKAAVNKVFGRRIRNLKKQENELGEELRKLGFDVIDNPKIAGKYSMLRTKYREAMMYEMDMMSVVLAEEAKK